ncbi:hypothetical protein EBH_0083800 [Eimeria brunetti]|uniref:Uncharacterized protein n=1 Tax=Eimeria brunetti TaxID=51314 RepID=U6LJZ2_9EIME|nr:hypothetical protein EBH_0083800 [Eimeria brunetti]
MPSAERLSKLAQLLTLQKVALTQIQDGIHMLAVCCQRGAESLDGDAEDDCLGALHSTVDERRNGVLQDDVLGKWLRGKQADGARFGFPPPRIIRAIIASPPRPYEELLEELRNTPLGLRQQQSNLRLMQQTGVEANIQDLGTPDPTTVSAGKLEAIRTSPKDLSSSEASVAEAAEPFGMATSAGHVPESLGAPGTNASLGMLDLAVAARASGVARAGGVSATASSPKVSDSVKPSDLVTTAKRFWRSQALQPQVSGQFATHELDITPADAERPRLVQKGMRPANSLFAFPVLPVHGVSKTHRVAKQPCKAPHGSLARLCVLSQ